MVTPAGQNHPHSWSLAQCSALNETPAYMQNETGSILNEDVCLFSYLLQVAKKRVYSVIAAVQEEFVSKPNYFWSIKDGVRYM